MDNDRDILLIAIFTFITVTAWIFFEFVKTTRTSTVAKNTNQLTRPIQATIDTKTLTTLSDRMIYR